MKQAISDDLLSFSSMLMLAHDRSEIIHLASELNQIIQKAMENENTNSILNTKRKTSSTTIKFNKEEIDMMSKTFKREFIANGCVGRIIKRPSGKNGFYYEIRYRRNGYNISVSNKDIKKAKELFVAATHNLELYKKSALNKLKFSTITSEWLEYKKNKIAFQTWQGYGSNIKKYFTDELCNRQITDIRTIDVDRFMRQFEENPRGYEDMRTVLNQIFKYAIASGIIVHNPVTLVPFKRAERKARDRLSDIQILAFLQRLKEPRFDRVRQLAYVLYFFGLRPCEIDDETRFENGFLICRNRKRKNGKIEYKKIPVPEQAQGLIDFNLPIEPQLSYDRWLDLLKEALSDKLTPYNLRHTFASICAEHVREEVVDIWMGDSPERLIGRTYIHYSDDFLKSEMNKVKFIL